jgi:hypothetical protein
MKKAKIKSNLILISICCQFYSCDLKISEKDIFLEKINTYEYYQPSSTIITNTGFITSFTKSITNGDSTNCEIVKSTDNYHAKIDFNGNVIWQKKARINDFLPTIFTEDKAGNIYSVSDWYTFDQIKVSDSTLKIKQNIKIKPNKLLNGNEVLKNILYWKDDKILAYGKSELTNQNNGEYLAKQFFCIIDKTGIIKIKYLEESIPENFNMNYSINEAGEIFGITYYSGVNYNTNMNKPGKIRIIKLDENLEVIKEKEIDFTEKVSQQINVKFTENNIHLIQNNAGINEYAIIDRNLNIEKYVLGPTFAYTTNFLKGNTNDITISETSSNNYTAINILKKNGSKIEKELLTETTFNLANAAYSMQNGKTMVYGIINTDTNNKPNITFIKSYNKITNKKVLFQSEYPKYYCSWWKD